MMRKISFALSTAAMALGFANRAVADRVEPQFTAGIATLTALPAAKPNNRGSQSIYPFADLAIGQSFGVKNKDARGMSSIVSNQNKKYREPVRDASGNPTYKMVAADNGSGGTMQVPDTSKPITTQTRLFRAYDVDAEFAKTLKGTPNEGAKSIVVRLDPDNPNALPAPAQG